LFFSRCKSPGSYGNCDLFVAQMRKDSTWGNIQNLGFNVNSIAWDSHPSLSHTEDTLYFASDRIGGFGLSDIYFTYRRGDGTWAPAQNVGPIINTRTNEVSPFFHPKFNTLYFSSNGHLLNFGEFDIYKSDRIGNIWDEPKNIGPLINGVGSEFYFTIDSDSRNLYYARSSGNNLKNLDLYSFPLPMEAQPGATTTLIGTLTDNVTEEPFQGIVSIIDLENGIEVAPKFLRPDGSYEFSLINNQNYLLIIQGDAFFRIEEIFFLEGDTELPKTTDHISSKMKFESIEFEVEKADLLPGMYGDLDKVINFLLDNPDFKIKISGHTDSHGTPEFNLDLSKRRAHAIREYLIYFGSIEDSRVEADGFGDTQSIVEEHTKDDASLNRRVEFEIFRPAK
ncbi:MAG: OmpA family protein, partial [Bacteroidetes bacterium]|nr:OmpA family protein [Bacteroidota bacterium]